MKAAAVTPSLYAAASALLRRRTGLVFSEARRRLLEDGLARTMQRVRVRDPELFSARLEAEPALLDELVSDVTVGETYFFRHPEQFGVIRQTILPELSARATRDRPLRIWSAACATGEEPYTLAIIAHESGLLERTRIAGTDISRVALARAVEAHYGRWSFRGVSDETIDRYFERTRDSRTLRAPMRDAVQFSYLNLAEDRYPSLASGIWGMDLILCCNVLIYFDHETVARIAQQLIEALSWDGWLFVGASGPPLAELVTCEVVLTAAGLAYRRRRAPARPPPTAGLTPAEPQERLAPVPERSMLPAPCEVEPLPRHPIPAGARREGHDAGSSASRAEVGGTTPDDSARLVRSAANRGELEAAGRVCIGALERYPTSAELLYLHAVLLGEGGRYTDAAAALRRALYLDRHMVVAHLALGNLASRARDLPTARRAFRNAAGLLARMAPDEVVPASDGERAGRLGEMASVHLALLDAEQSA